MAPLDNTAGRRERNPQNSNAGASAIRAAFQRCAIRKTKGVARSAALTRKKGVMCCSETSESTNQFSLMRVSHDDHFIKICRQHQQKTIAFIALNIIVLHVHRSEPA